MTTNSPMPHSRPLHGDDLLTMPDTDTSDRGGRDEVLEEGEDVDDLLWAPPPAPAPASAASSHHPTAFARWLSDQLWLRNWEPAELARRTGIKEQSISVYRHDGVVPRVATCRKLAHGLSKSGHVVTVSEILLVCGHLQPGDLRMPAHLAATREGDHTVTIALPPEAGGSETLPLPSAPLEMAALHTARLAILSVPDSALDDTAKLALVSLMQQLHVATTLAQGATAATPVLPAAPSTPIAGTINGPYSR